MPELSVLLCVKDSAEMISAAVRSTLRALPRDSQLAVLDDGSTDATHDVVTRIDDSRLTVYRNERPIGPGAARAQLLAETDSEFVAIMDGDDICLPWRFRTQRKAIEDADLLFSPIVRFGPRRWNLRPGAPLPIDERAMPLHLLLGCALSHPTLFARRAAVVNAGGYRDCQFDDYDLYLRAAAAGSRLRRNSIISVAYRRHAGQVTAAPDFHTRDHGRSLIASAFLNFVNAELGSGDRPESVSGREPSEGWLWPDGSAARWAVLDREMVRRDLSALQRRVLVRHARVSLGPRPA
jgi:glycosyltransferase involved in cell wall biosynthesis